MIRRCHGCGSTNVRRSAPRSLAERLMILLLCRPYRCLRCDLRYYSFAFSKRADRLAHGEKPRAEV